jgi:hypothetical protein
MFFFTQNPREEVFRVTRADWDIFIVRVQPDFDDGDWTVLDLHRFYVFQSHLFAGAAE